VAVNDVPLSQERERFTGMFPEVWDSFPSRMTVMPLMVAPLGIPREKSPTCATSVSSQVEEQVAYTLFEDTRVVVLKVAHPACVFTAPSVVAPVVEEYPETVGVMRVVRISITGIDPYGDEVIILLVEVVGQGYPVLLMVVGRIIPLCT
jgi:hypothetical protein